MNSLASSCFLFRSAAKFVSISNNVYPFRLVSYFIIQVFSQSSQYLFGPSFGIGKYPGNHAIITSFETTLIPGAPPNPAQLRLAIWPGLDTSNGDLIQPIIVSSNEAQYTKRVLKSYAK
jgi:hypothetical protein